MERFSLTIPDMLSDDYRRRFKAEYHQLAIRTSRLKDFLLKIEAGEDVQHDCPTSTLKEQYDVMCAYLNILESRAVKENIEL